jgi:hypothetical protein
MAELVDNRVVVSRVEQFQTRSNTHESESL